MTNDMMKISKTSAINKNTLILKEDSKNNSSERDTQYSERRARQADGIQRTAQSGMQSKNDTDLAHRNFAIHQKILIIFGKKIPLRE